MDDYPDFCILADGFAPDVSVGKHCAVLMASPPRLTTMRSGLLANVDMTLVGVLDE